jgi:hypothetical protein
VHFWCTRDPGGQASTLDTRERAAACRRNRGESLLHLGDCQGFMQLDRLLTMTFHMNPDFPRQLAEQIQRLGAALTSVSSKYAGRPVAEVRGALLEAVNAVGNGASISDPELSVVATRISEGKRVWITETGSIMSDD